MSRVFPSLLDHTAMPPDFFDSDPEMATNGPLLQLRNNCHFWHQKYEKDSEALIQANLNAAGAIVEYAACLDPALQNLTQINSLFDSASRCIKNFITATSVQYQVLSNAKKLIGLMHNTLKASLTEMDKFLKMAALVDRVAFDLAHYESDLDICAQSLNSIESMVQEKSEIQPRFLVANVLADSVKMALAHALSTASLAMHKTPPSPAKVEIHKLWVTTNHATDEFNSILELSKYCLNRLQTVSCDVEYSIARLYEISEKEIIDAELNTVSLPIHEWATSCIFLGDAEEAYDEALAAHAGHSSDSYFIAGCPSDEDLLG